MIELTKGQKTAFSQLSQGMWGGTQHELPTATTEKCSQVTE